MNILTSDNPNQAAIDLSRKGSYEVGDLVRVTNRYGPSTCYRADNTGSGWSVVAGTVWTVERVGRDDHYNLHDGNRPELEGKKAFVALGVAGVNLEPVEQDDAR